MAFWFRLYMMCIAFSLCKLCDQNKNNVYIISILMIHYVSNGTQFLPIFNAINACPCTDLNDQNSDATHQETFKSHACVTQLSNSEGVVIK